MVCELTAETMVPPPHPEVTGCSSGGRLGRQAAGLGVSTSGEQIWACFREFLGRVNLETSGEKVPRIWVTFKENSKS